MRRLRALIVGLPEDSRLARSVDPDSWWRPEHELLTMITEAVLNHSVLYSNAHRRRGAAAKPIRLPRPSDSKSSSVPLATTGELRAFFRRGD